MPQDIHSALKTEILANVEDGGLNAKLVKMQSSKTDVGYSLHVAPSSFSFSGIQTTDLLNYLGFQRTSCAYQIGGQGYCRWASEGFDLKGFVNAFIQSYANIVEAEKRLNACGYALSRPEGISFFSGSSSSGNSYNYDSYPSGDGHNSPSTQLMKETEDENFKFVFSWIEGGKDKGWTTHYRPKHPPASLVVQAALDFLKVRTFPECPFFDFEECYWRFTPFGAGYGVFGGNAETAHQRFDAHASSFSPGLERLILAHSVMEPLGLGFLPVKQKAETRQETEIAQRVTKPAKPVAKGTLQTTYDVAISFAGTNREQAKALAGIVKDAGFSVFYDDFYPEQLWGKNLIEFFDEIYRKRSRYVVMFVSKEYEERIWTNHERRSAQARALTERGTEYILPIQVDKTELPGAPPTFGYLSLDHYSIERIGEILISKLRGS